jgi:long-chain fatty acid transport protein
MTRFRTLFVAFALIGATATQAHAGGILTAYFAGEEGHVTTSNPSASYYNPAGLALRGGTRFFVEGAFGYRYVSYNRPVEAIGNVAGPGEGGTPADALDVNFGKAKLLNPVAVPFAAVASDLGVPNLGVGLSFSVPFGGAANWSKNENYEGNSMYPGAVDGTQRWAIISGSVQATYVTAAAAYYFPQLRLSIGAGLNLVNQQINVLQARNVLSTDDVVNAQGGIVEGRALIDASSTGFSASGGLIWSPTDALQVGASYQSQPEFGKTTMTGDLTIKIGTDNASTTPVDFEQELPDIVRVGGSYRLSPELELRAQFDYQRWSVMKNQCLLDAANAERKCDLNEDGSLADTGAAVTQNFDRGWKDSFAVHGGASYFFSDAFKLMGGLTFDSTPVPDRTLDPGFVDSNKLIAALQGHYQFSSSLALSARWTQFFFAKRTSDNTTLAPTPTRTPSTAGEYKQSVGLFTLAAEYAF